MTTNQMVLVLLGLLGAVPVTSGSMSLPAGDPQVTLEGRLNCPFIASGGGTVYLHIILSTGDVLRGDRARRPMNLAVVLDRSGSMGEQRKMEYAKSALNKLIDQLSSEDVFSVVAYDDVIDVLRSARRVGGSRSELKQLVSDIYPRNSTNLGGGMLEGLRQVERNIGREYVNRVILLSDGLANQGITDTHELNRIARRYRSKGISLTTMGVGLDYNENLMVGLSESGGGNYYFIETPSQLASIMHREFNSASSVIAQNAVLELKLGRGVRLLDVVGCESVSEGDVYRIPLGDVYANDTREFTVEMSVPEGRGTLEAARGTLRCDGARLGARPSFSVKVRYTNDVALMEKQRDLEVQAKADIAVSTRQVERALKAFDEGQEEEAKQELAAAEALLANSPAAGGAGSAAIREQTSRLRSYRETMQTDDARRAKKAIQYENYRVQKKK